MFGGPFNTLPFNLTLEIDVMVSAELRGEGSIAVSAILEAAMNALMDGVGTVSANMIRELYMDSQLDGNGSMNAVILREALAAAALNGVGSLTATVGRYRVDSLSFTGAIETGDYIVIDSKQLTLTKNGQNALHQMQGDFFGIELGLNTIKITDMETNRSVLLRITHRDKFV